MGLEDILKKLFPPSEDTRETVEPSWDDSASNEDVSENGEDPAENDERNGSTEQDPYDTESSTTEETQENDPQEVEEEEDSGGGGAKKLVCKGAITSCNSSETPMQIPLKIISQSKFFINDSAGSEKLIASTMELPQPFDAPFFGKCKLQPAGNSFLPCSVAITKWQNAYEDVELSNGGKILTEDSTAICSFGGTIKIEKHGQGPAQINEAQVENGSTSASPTLNPLVDSSDIEILAGGNLDDNETDEKGAGVKKIATTGGKTTFAKGTWISFKVTEWFNPNATNKDKVNWQVKDAAGGSVQDFVDKGESIAILLVKNGTYTVEAYGGSAGGKQAATCTVTIKNPELGAITKTSADKIRIGETVTFSIAPDVGKPDFFLGADNVVWKLYKSTNGGKTYTEETSILNLSQGSQQSIPFPEKGHYLIKATINDKTVEQKIEATTNYVNVIEAEKDAMRTNTDSITFKVKEGGYNLNPATAVEKQKVKWVVYDKDKKKVDAYSATGETFTLSNVKTEGIYYVEAYMQSSEIGKVTSSKTPASIVKIEVTTPKVNKVTWVDGKRYPKHSCGYGEEVYAWLKLDAYNGEKVKLKFYNIQTDNSVKQISESGALTVTSNGIIIFPLNFSKSTDKQKLKNGTQQGTGYVVFEVIPVNTKDTILNGKLGLDFSKMMKINIKDVESLYDIYFEEDGKRIRQVAFGKKITAHIKTYNMVGKKLEVDLYRLDKALGYDNLSPDGKMDTYTATVDKEGKASFEITIKESWKNASGNLEDFYFQPKDIPWYSITHNNKAAFKAYLKNETSSPAQQPVDVEKGNGSKKPSNNKCPRCDEDFKYEDIVKIFPTAAKNQNLAKELIVEMNTLRNEYEVNTCIRKAHLINQFGSETGFRTLKEEIDGYSVSTLKRLFGYFSRHPAEATKYKGNLYEIAIRAYGLRKVDKAENIVACNIKPGGKCNDLGNETMEDGYTYIGRGLIQLTGKYNYTQINKSFQKAFSNKGDLIKNPELLEQPKYAAMSAFSYWINNNLNKKADLGYKPSNVDAITKIINKHLDVSHYKKRKDSFIKAKEVYRLDECENLTSSSDTSKIVIRLTRKWQTTKSTIGEFTIDGTTIEGFILEEKGPDTTTSGIEQRVPIGTYNLVWHNGTKFKDVLKLYNDKVSVSRSILIHAGNSATDTEGCLLPGASKSKDWVSHSKNKLKEINDHVKKVGIEGAKIIITQNYE